MPMSRMAVSIHVRYERHSMGPGFAFESVAAVVWVWVGGVTQHLRHACVECENRLPNRDMIRLAGCVHSPI